MQEWHGVAGNVSPFGHWGHLNYWDSVFPFGHKVNVNLNTSYHINFDVSTLSEPIYTSLHIYMKEVKHTGYRYTIQYSVT
jgi:hypothetical protein